MAQIVDSRCVLAVRDLAISTRYYIDILGFTKDPIDGPGVTGDGWGSDHTFLTLSGATADQVRALEEQLNQMGFLSGALPGQPHDGYDGNFRQNTMFNSLQINTNADAGRVEINIDPYGPGYGVGYALHGLLQVLPNTITGNDTNYLTVGNNLGMWVECR